MVRSRKGHYRELFEQTAKNGFLKVRVDGQLLEITPGMKVDRFKTHDIEIVIDQLIIKKDNLKRLEQSLKTAIEYGNGLVMLIDKDNGQQRFFSKHIMCSDTGISYAQPEPNSFSFNSPKGACQKCNGLGVVSEVSIEKIINAELSINNGGLIPLNNTNNKWFMQQLTTIAKRFDFSLSTPIKQIPQKGIDAVLYGIKESFVVNLKSAGLNKEYKIDFDGIVDFIEDMYHRSPSTKTKRWANDFMSSNTCSHCHGSRLKKESLFFKIDNKNISEVAKMDIDQLKLWVDNVESTFNENKN